MGGQAKNISRENKKKEKPGPH